MDIVMQDCTSPWMVQRHGCAQVAFRTNDVNRKFDRKLLMDWQCWKLLPIGMIAGQSSQNKKWSMANACEFDSNEVHFNMKEQVKFTIILNWDGQKAKKLSIWS